VQRSRSLREGKLSTSGVEEELAHEGARMPHKSGKVDQDINEIRQMIEGTLTNHRASKRVRMENQ
jgi:hypothetical protein